MTTTRLFSLALGLALAGCASKRKPAAAPAPPATEAAPGEGAAGDGAPRGTEASPDDAEDDRADPDEGGE